MNNDLISREALHEEISTLAMTITGLRAGKGVLNEFMKEYRKSVLKIVDDAPAVDAVEVVHGRWLDRPKNQGWKDEEIGTVGMVDGEPWSSCYCSECGEWLVASDEYSVKGNYCPNCGADMRGESNE